MFGVSKHLEELSAIKIDLFFLALIMLFLRLNEKE